MGQKASPLSEIIFRHVIARFSICMEQHFNSTCIWRIYFYVDMVF